jgi:hypothetical protein
VPRPLATNRRVRARTAGPRLTQREAARDVLDALGFEREARALDPFVGHGPSLMEEELASFSAALASKRVGLGLAFWFRARRLLAHEPEHQVGDRVKIRVGDRVGSVEKTAKRRARPSSAGSRLVLLELVDRVRAAAEGLDAHRTAALLLLVHDLDTSRNVWPRRDDRPPPTGRARVRWLAARLRDLTRERGGVHGDWAVRKLRAAAPRILAIDSDRSSAATNPEPRDGPLAARRADRRPLRADRRR